MVEVATSRKFIVEEKLKKGFNFVRGFEFPNPKVILARVRLMGVIICLQDHVGTTEGELVLLRIVPDEFILMVALGREVIVSDDTLEI